MMSRRQAEGAGFAMILAFAGIGMGFIGWVLPVSKGGGQNIPLGQWSNMPSNSTELLGNTSYRGLIIASGTAPSIRMIVSCIVPSNTVGANLQLQYANFSLVTNTNITKFANAGPTVLIDNSANYPCPGFPTQSSSFPL